MTQSEALSILQSGANVFLTGEPGSGKTHTINQYVAWLRRHKIEPAITASTGIAATHIGGQTIHSWSGIGVRQSLTEYDLDYISQNKTIVGRVAGTHVLIIDEISMLSASTLTMVEAVCREIRRDVRPFGGLQVVFVGDFFQLPPIVRAEGNLGDLFSDGGSRMEFAFESSVWRNTNPLTCYISEQHRQEDSVFLELLSAIRQNNFLPTHRELLIKRKAHVAEPDVTHLYSHNADVDAINTKELAKLEGKSHGFQMMTSGVERLVETIKRGCLSPETLTLKVGARVMFTKNDPVMHKFVNGTLGVVSSFSKENGYPAIKTNSGKTIIADPVEWSLQESGRTLARVVQVPLRLAWAITVHKSQGMSLDAAHMDLSGAFEYGQGYVALSRVRTLKNLSLAGFNDRALEVHPKVLLRDAQFREESDAALRAFASIPKEELATMYENFIHACRGSMSASRSGKQKKVRKPRAAVI